jgi:glucuronokinase
MQQGLDQIHKSAFSRAGLIGNPSDGYHGKTISIIVPDYRAEVILSPSKTLEIIPAEEDQSRFPSIDSLRRDVRLHGYYGGVRLIKATIKRFGDYCESIHEQLKHQNFTISYSTNIPRQVGLGGSSAIVVATLRCLMEYFGVAIAPEIQPSLARAVEVEELGIPAGLQDRVIQVYEGLVYMDFGKSVLAAKHGYEVGRYERLDPEMLPPVYIAFSKKAAEPTEVPHNDLRARYKMGDSKVLAAVARWAELAELARTALIERDHAGLFALINENFDLRLSVMKLAPSHVEMVNVARQAGASAKFAGSGGAIIGTLKDDADFPELQKALGAIECEVLRIH